MEPKQNHNQLIKKQEEHSHRQLLELTLEEIATSTLQQFSLDTPKIAFSPHRMNQQKKNPRISTWYNDPEAKGAFSSINHKYRHSAQCSQRSPQYEAASNVLFQLTKSLKSTEPKYAYKLKLRKHQSMSSTVQKEQGSTVQQWKNRAAQHSLDSRARIRFSTHLIPTPSNIGHNPRNSILIKKNTGTAIKKIKSDLIHSIDYKTPNKLLLPEGSLARRPSEARQNHSQFQNQNSFSSFHKTGMFRASIVLKTKKKQQLEQEQEQFLICQQKTKKKQRKQMQLRSSNPISQTPECRLIQSLIELERI